ncbi:MAG TPA: cytochrome c [Rhizomicrobium sp.]|jgi:mono/diheme cytochrome c family protein|nr:cytochrome c [Rhizomicrobium sp.]
MKVLNGSLAALLAVAIASLVTIGHARANDAVARGKYLATLGDCEICHTAPNGGAPYAGGYPLHAYFGTVYSTNITPDRKTGIGGWTADQFYRALHHGIAADGAHLYPAFPYNYFTRTPRADSDAILAYLKTLKPVFSPPTPNHLIFPTNIRATMTFWNLLFLDETPIKPDPSKSAAWNRGDQIVNGLGHCGACHTPKNIFFSDESGKAFQGETIDGWHAPNLTGSNRDGLGAWTESDIAGYLRTGRNRFGRVTGSMQDVVRISTSRMTDSDRAAIATYLKSLPPAPEQSIPKPEPAVMQTGKAVFVQRCSVCHAEHGPAYPSLAGNSVVQSRDPSTVLRVILQGSQAAPTPNGPIGYSMPAFPVLNDTDLAAVATYIRNNWGNRAPPVSPGQAKELRGLVLDSN